MPLRVIVFVWGMGTVIAVVASAIRTLVLPRSTRNRITRYTFQSMNRLFLLRLHWTKEYLDRDRVLALFPAVGLLFLIVVWLMMVVAGYTGMYWAIGSATNRSLRAAFMLSGSSVFTLGFAPLVDLPSAIVAFSEATIGLTLVALLISYLPTMYGAFSRRELAVTMLEVRAGSPPSAVEMLRRFNRLGQIERVHEVWLTWELWFADIEETHASLAALTFFRSPQPDHSWVTAAGAVLDAAAMYQSVIDVPPDYQAALCIRAGYIALQRIAGYFSLPYNPTPAATDPISVTRAEFEVAYDQLANSGVAVKADRDLAWVNFSGWRVNYDGVLIALAQLTSAPPAPWSSDRLTK